MPGALLRILSISDTKDGRLIVKHPTDLMEKGYVPYLLRYSKKKPRYRDIEDRHTLEYGPVMRGWHLFYDEKKLRTARRCLEKTKHGVNVRWFFQECLNMNYPN